MSYDFFCISQITEREDAYDRNEDVWILYFQKYANSGNIMLCVGFFTFNSNNIF